MIFEKLFSDSSKIIFRNFINFSQCLIPMSPVVGKVIATAARFNRIHELWCRKLQIPKRVLQLELSLFFILCSLLTFSDSLLSILHYFRNSWDPHSIKITRYFYTHFLDISQHINHYPEIRLHGYPEKLYTIYNFLIMIKEATSCENMI